MRVLLFCILSMLATPAVAQEIALKSDCQALSAASKSSAEYKPGVDVHGKPVAPADLEPAIEAIAYPLVIPVEIDNLRALGLVNLDTDVAFVTLFESGRIEYNGQDISDRMSHSCIDEENDDDPVFVYADEGAQKEAPKDPQPSGQKSADDVPSGAVDDNKSVIKKQEPKDKDQSKDEPE